MGQVTALLGATLASIAHVSAAMSQTVCAIECPRERIQFSGCGARSAEHALRERVGIIGMVTGRDPGAYCKSRVLVDVLQASMENMPPHVAIDFDPCVVWIPQNGDRLNIYVWQRASSNTGAYTLAPCPEQK
jgi:hypothetical protein